jgi:hypothetical protein
MNFVKKIILLSFVLFAAVMLFGGRNIIVADDNLNCTGEGAWTAIDPDNNTWLLLTTPLDNTKKRLGASVTPVDFDPTLGGFPNVVTLTPLHGTIEQAGTNLYDYQWVGYGLDANHDIVYIMRSRGTLSFDDCDTVTASGRLGLYHPSQDPFGPVPPIYGCDVSVSTAVRDPMMPPCE